MREVQCKIESWSHHQIFSGNSTYAESPLFGALPPLSSVPYFPPTKGPGHTAYLYQNSIHFIHLIINFMINNMKNLHACLLTDIGYP